MSILFSRQCEYALQAVMYLALKQDHETTSIRELTEKLDIPFHFLAKILQELTHKGLLISQKGPAGGFGLGVRAEAINLLQIIEAIDGTGFRNNCVLGFEECSKTDPCALHEEWSRSRDTIISMLEKNGIAQMAVKMHKPQYRTKAKPAGKKRSPSKTAPPKPAL
jgi:Rrf2 family transcriptional regulator, iron-sulfur cluster assembly transcription factor